MTPYDPDPLDIVEWHRGAQDRRRSLRPIHALLAGLLGVALGFLVARATLAASRPPVDVIPAGGTHDVEPDLQRATEAPRVILEPLVTASPMPRASVEQPAPELVTVTEKPVVVNPPSSGARGPASWYDDPRKAGLYAAAGPALRVGDWRGRTVTVCASTCFAVVLSDWCQCPGGRVIDLSSTAFARLAPLSQGIVGVTVTW